MVFMIYVLIKTTVPIQIDRNALVKDISKVMSIYKEDLEIIDIISNDTTMMAGSDYLAKVIVSTTSSAQALEEGKIRKVTMFKSFSMKRKEGEDLEALAERAMVYSPELQEKEVEIIILEEEPDMCQVVMQYEAWQVV